MFPIRLKNVIEEGFRFFLFILLLSLVSVALTSVRIQDQSYNLTDSGISESELASLQENSGFWIRYADFWRDALFQEGGKTLSGEPVYPHIFQRWEASLHLAFFSIVLAVVFGFGFVLSGVYWDNSPIQKFTIIFSEFILSTPIFVFAVGFQILFFYEWALLPPGGYETWDIRYLILPGVTLAMRAFARFAIYLFKEIQTELESPFFFLLKARGYPKHVIIFRNLFWKVLPISLIFLVLELSALLSGAMIVEEIFYFPGIGRSQFSAIKSMDGNLLQSLLFLTGMLVYFFTRGTELLQARLLGKTAL